MKKDAATFAQLGEIFNDATTRLVGGVSDQNQAKILKDLSIVQSGLQHLIQQNPDEFQGVSGVHAQNVVDQINLEISAVKSVGTDPFAPKYINDVQRDLIDIVQGDAHLAELASQGGHNGFGPVPDLLVPPAQFQGNAEQTKFMQDFITTTQGFVDRANALAGHNDPAAVQQLVGEIQAYAKAANAFAVAQGGLYSARFNNEFADSGVNGTASRALIDGLQTGNADKIHAAGEVLAANAADVAGNMLGIGADPPPAAGNGIPDHIDTIAQAGTVFNDATTKLIGGVYDGNRQSIHNDLAAVQQGFTDLVAQNKLDGQAKSDAAHIAELIGREIALVDGGGQNAAAKINALHTQVIETVHKDAALAGQTGDAGFMALPGKLPGDGAVQVGHGNGHGRSGSDPHDGGSAHHAGMDQHGHTDPMTHIFADAGHHFLG